MPAEYRRYSRITVLQSESGLRVVWSLIAPMKAAFRERRCVSARASASEVPTSPWACRSDFSSNATLPHVVAVLHARCGQNHARTGRRAHVDPLSAPRYSCAGVSNVFIVIAKVGTSELHLQPWMGRWPAVRRCIDGLACHACCEHAPLQTGLALRTHSTANEATSTLTGPSAPAWARSSRASTPAPHRPLQAGGAQPGRAAGGVGLDRAGAEEGGLPACRPSAPVQLQRVLAV